MRNSNLLQSSFALPDDGGSMILQNNSGALLPTYMVSHPEDSECHDNLKPSMFFKTKVTVCITNVVKKFCARHTPTLCSVLLLVLRVAGFFEAVVYA